MTEDEWNACDSPRLMLRELRRSGPYPTGWASWLGGQRLPPEYRAFLFSCAERLRPVATSAALRAVIDWLEWCVKYEPGARMELPWRASSLQARELLSITHSTPACATATIRRAAGHLARRGHAGTAKESAMRAALRREELAQCDLVRCHFAGPAGLGPFDPAWRTPNVVAVAEGIRRAKAWGDLPILGDALEEAGCDDVNLLRHCRAPVHGGGCRALAQVSSGFRQPD
jgi:hypothetical protein